MFTNLFRSVFPATTAGVGLQNPNVSGSETTVSKAVCMLKGDQVNGVIRFNQADPEGPTTITGEIKGLPPGLHGFHVHEWGDNSEGCKTAGDHFNPLKRTHGGPRDDTRHLGDLGNVEADIKGVAKVDITDRMITLNGPFSVIGRTMVCHANEDDLGKGGNADSLKTGNAGARIACGVIGLAAPGK